MESLSDRSVIGTPCGHWQSPLSQRGHFHRVPLAAHWYGTHHFGPQSHLMLEPFFRPSPCFVPLSFFGLDFHLHAQILARGPSLSSYFQALALVPRPSTPFPDPSLRPLSQACVLPACSGDLGLPTAVSRDLPPGLRQREEARLHLARSSRYHKRTPVQMWVRTAWHTTIRTPIRPCGEEGSVGSCFGASQHLQSFVTQILLQAL